MNMDFIRANIQSCKTCYNKENDPSKCLGCVTHGEGISDFKLLPKIDEYLKEVEQSIELAEAVKFAFYKDYELIKSNYEETTSSRISELIGWHRKWQEHYERGGE